MTVKVRVSLLERAACRAHDPELWFSDSRKKRDEARRICDRCPVKADCETFSAEEDYGIWAGAAKEPPRQEEHIPFPCPDCGQKFAGHRGVAHHRRMAHNKERR